MIFSSRRTLRHLEPGLIQLKQRRKVEVSSAASSPFHSCRIHHTPDHLQLLAKALEATTPQDFTMRHAFYGSVMLSTCGHIKRPGHDVRMVCGASYLHVCFWCMRLMMAGLAGMRCRSRCEGSGFDVTKCVFACARR